MFNYSLVLSTKALNDTRKALAWYDDISINIKLQFIDELDVFYDRIEKNPERYGYFKPLIHLRRAKLKQFPYYILYTINVDIIRIAGVVHTSRSPRFVRRRYR
jgi:toxin ParE1/3/4